MKLILNKLKAISLVKIELTISLCSLILNGVGFGLIYKEVSIQAEATSSSASTGLTELSFGVLNFIADNPKIYPYFYGSKPLVAGDTNNVQVLLCAEMIANYCENVIEQRNSMTADSWTAWQSFIQQQCASSPALKAFIKKYRDWYHPELYKASIAITANKAHPSNKTQ